MATPVTSMKWRLQFRQQSLTNETTYYIEYTSESITVEQLSALVKRLSTLGYVGASFGLVVVLP